MALKKIIKMTLPNRIDKQVVCLRYEQGKATLGGDYRLQEIIWDIYAYCFGECDGEPHFYEVERGKTRMTFNCSFKNYNQALDRILGEGYELIEVESFNRQM